MNTFEFATRNKLRFPFRGMCSVEDLWDLSREQLDQVYKALIKETKQDVEESLIAATNEVDNVLKIKIEIVKYIFETKCDEIYARQVQIEKAEKKQKLLELLEKKRENALQNKSEEDLLAMLKELDN